MKIYWNITKEQIENLAFVKNGKECKIFRSNNEHEKTEDCKGIQIFSNFRSLLKSQDHLLIFVILIGENNLMNVVGNRSHENTHIESAGMYSNSP